MISLANRAARGLAALALLAAVAACSGADVEYSYPTTVGTGGKPSYEERQSVLGRGGLNLFEDEQVDAAPDSGIAVNSYLWRASLDTVSFMPLASADPFGGVIITDWYAPADTSDERFKINIFILDRALRSDGVRASVFKQMMSAGAWRDIKSDEKLDRQLEDAILTRARQLRIAKTGR